MSPSASRRSQFSNPRGVVMKVRIDCDEPINRPKTWLWIGFVGLIVYVGLKATQVYFERNSAVSLAGLLELMIAGFLRRSDDLSFYNVVAAFVSIWFLAVALNRAGLAVNVKGTPHVIIEPRHLAVWTATAFLGVALYIWAVFRDHGTFFWSWESDAKDPRIHMVQVIEGLFNTFLIVFAFGWVLLGHALLRWLPAPEIGDRETTLSEAYLWLARACLVPVVVGVALIGLQGFFQTRGLVGPWTGGIANVFAAVGTNLILWILFVILFIRTIGRGEAVIELSVWPVAVAEAKPRKSRAPSTSNPQPPPPPADGDPLP